MDIQEKLEQGIAAAEAGKKVEARMLLTEVIQTDENQLEAWLWLSQVLDSLEDRAVCLENVLSLDPDNEFAWEQLTLVKERQEKLFASIYAPGEEEPLPQVIPPSEPPLEIKAVYPHQPDEFDNPWLCPYCVAPTQPKDRVCPACHHLLVVRVRTKEARTVWLWRGIFLQFALAFIPMALGTGSFALIAKWYGIANVFPFLPAYIGLPVDQPSAQIETLLTVVPRWAFWTLIGFVVYSLLLMAILYFRVPNGHVVHLTNAGLMLALGVVGGVGSILVVETFSIPLLVASAIVLMIGGVQLLIAMNLWDDFTFEETRLRLTLDLDVVGHTSLFLSGRKYSELGMWGRAVIHLRRAVIKEEKPLYYIALAVAYINLRRYDMAQGALARAEKLDPDSQQIKQLKNELTTRIKG